MSEKINHGDRIHHFWTPTDPPKDVPPHIAASTVAIAPGDAEHNLLTEYKQDADRYWRDAMDIRYSRIESVRPGDAPTYIEANIVLQLSNDRMKSLHPHRTCRQVVCIET